MSTPEGRPSLSQQAPITAAAPRASTSSYTSPPSPGPRAENSKSPIMPTFAVPYRIGPPSVESIAQPTDADVYNLAPLDKQISNSSDEPAASVGGGTAEDEYKGQRPKPSREPLIPLSTRPSFSRPAMLRDRSGSGTGSSGGPLSPSRSATGRLVRTSLERVFSLRRGMSFESLRRNNSVRDGRSAPFEGKPSDEEHGMFDLPSPYKNSMATAPGDFPSSMQHTPSASPTPSFSVPRPPSGPPRDAMPVLDPTTHKRLRNYQLHPSRNRFFLNGRIMTGGDSPWAFIGSFTLLLTMVGVWFGTTAVWWWRNESPAVAAVGAYMALISLSSMLATATRDPGILPRNLDPDPPYPATSPSDGGLRAPMPRDLKGPRGCGSRQILPDMQDVPPPALEPLQNWVNNCIGRRNYTTFFVLLLSATLSLILMIVTAALHLFWLAHRAPAGTPRKHVFQHALSHGAGSAVVFCLGIIVIWPVGALLSYHMRLLLLNVTTIEQIRNQAHKSLVPGPAPPNPFSHGSWRRNLLQVLCRPVGYSWLDAPGFATQDERDVNPGFIQRGGGKERQVGIG
ncbi:Palmitoyltransferase [Mycena venus]|uniref:Palmitoyltransferase n=1 Tax=Mycena venus TaxID=2733690 RepID=A0A8H6XBT6_9AGAR|nr:Palmitoyltransferase [Mycena venus]